VTGQTLAGQCAMDRALQLHQSASQSPSAGAKSQPSGLSQKHEQSPAGHSGWHEGAPRGVELLLNE